MPPRKDPLLAELLALRADFARHGAQHADHSNDIAEIKADLREHMKRTHILESWMSRWNGIWAAILGLGVLAGIAASVVKIFG